MRRRILTAGFLAWISFSGAAGADRYFRLSRDGKTIGFHQVGEDTPERDASGREVLVRRSRSAILATYVGASEIHVVRETTTLDPATGRALAYSIVYGERGTEEIRHASFTDREASIRVLSDGKVVEERRVELPERALIRCDYESIARAIATRDDLVGSPIHVVDARTLASEVCVLAPGRAESIAAGGGEILCVAYALEADSNRSTIWLEESTKRLVQVREGLPSGALLVTLADPRVVDEVSGIEVTAPPLARVRDLPWRFDREYVYEMEAAGEKAGTIRFTFTPIRKDDATRIAVTSSIELEAEGHVWKSQALTHYDQDLAPVWFEFGGTQKRPDRERETRTEVHLTMADGLARLVFKKDNVVHEKTQPVPPGCQLLHDNQIEHFALFLSQIDLEPERTTRINVYHSGIFRSFLLEARTGEPRTEGERRVVPAHLACEAFEADVVLDESGRLLTYTRGNSAIRLVESAD